MSLRTLRKFGGLAASALLCASSAWAAFTRIDGIDTTPIGTLDATTSGGVWARTGTATTSVFQIASVDSTKVIAWQGSAGGANYITRTLPTALSSGTATLFFRLRPATGTNFDHAIGLTQAAGTPYTGFGVQFGVAQGAATSTCDFTNRPGTGNVVIKDELARDQWYNVWIVVNATAKTYDTYVTTGLNTATAADKVASALAFRDTTVPLTRVLLTCNTATGLPALNGNISHIAIDYAGENLNNPASVTDTDADGLLDSWEILYFTSLSYGPSDDPDGDGFSNLLEFQAGTNPSVANTVLFPSPTVKLAPDGYYLAGNALTLTAVATGQGTLSYQWSKNGTPISGATSTSYTVSSAATTADNATYSLTVTDNRATNFGFPATTTTVSSAVTVIPEAQAAVAYYRFEEGSSASAFGSTTPDSIGSSALNVTAPIAYAATVASPTIVRSSVANTLSADFSNQTSVPAGRGFASTTSSTLDAEAFTNFTIEAFVRFASISGFQTLVGRDDTGAPGLNTSSDALLYFQKNSGNAFRGLLTDRTGASIDCVGTITAAANTWYHVALVGNAADRTLKLYVNGTLSGTATNFGGLFVPPSGVAPWSLGRGYYGSAATDYLNGFIDEVRFSKVALQPTQFLISSLDGLISFATQPSNTTATVGQSVTLSASAVGFPEPTLQWQYSSDAGATWTAISGATTSSYVISSVTYANRGLYRVVATNTSGTVTSNAATLTVVYPAPTITVGPLSQTVAAGTTLNLSVTATGMGTLTYQWFKDGVAISGATAATLSVSGIAATAGGVYSVTVSDSAATAVGLPATTASASATITVLAVAQATRAISLNFTGAATGSTTWATDAGTLASTDAAGFLPVTNWNNLAATAGVATQLVPQALVENTGTGSGSTVTWISTNTWAATATGGTAASKTADKRLFHGYIETRSNTRLAATTVTVANIPYAQYDVYVYLAGGGNGPVGKTSVNDGSSTTYYYKVLSHDSFVATNPIPYRIGASTTLEDAQLSTTLSSTFVRFAAQTNATLVITTTDAVSGTNAGGIAAIQIVDTTPTTTARRPYITTLPVSQTVASGSTASLSVTALAAHGGTLAYQWRKNGEVISGATSATLSLGTVSSAAAARYTVTVTETSSLGTASSTAYGDLVVLDTNRPLLINGDIKLSSGKAFSGYGNLRSSTPYVVDNDGQIGAGTQVWNRLVGAAGSGSAAITAESTGLALQGVSFSWTDATGIEQDATPVNGMLAVPTSEGELADWALSGSEMLLDYLYSTSTTTPISCTVGGLSAYAGKKFQVLVYAVGRIGYQAATSDNGDNALVTLNAANNYLGTAAKLTNNYEGRDLRYNNAAYRASNPANDMLTDCAYVVFEGIVSSGGTVSWTVGAPASVDAARPALNGFQLLILDATANVAPSITAQPTPATQTKYAGSTVVYTIGATGSPAPTIQWQFSSNGGSTWTNVSGGVGATLTLTNVSASSAGQYRAVLSSTAGTITSDAVTLAIEVVGDYNNDGAADGPVLITGDAANTTSFNAGLNWSDVAVPVSGKTYIVPIEGLRTPTSGANTFAGSKLVLTTSAAFPNGGALILKSDSPTTIPLLQLDGGYVNHAATGAATLELGGSIVVTRASRLFANNGPLTVTAGISGSANLTLSGTNPASRVTLSGTSTLTGNVIVTAPLGLTLASTGTLTFVPGASGVTNVVSGTTAAAFDGTFAINLTGASTTTGASWTLVTTTGTKTYGSTFTVAGFTADSAAAGARKWTSGVYQFDEATGVLSVVGTPLTALQNWRVLYFGTSENTGTAANTADPDGDGLTNLFEYATSSNPLTANGGPVVTLNATTQLLSLQFTQPGDSTLTFKIQASSNLSTWTDVQTITGQTTAGTITYTDTVAPVAGTPRFLRLVVSSN